MHGWHSFTISVVTNIVLASVLFFIFVLLRPRLKYIYEVPRLDNGIPRVAVKGLLAWVLPIWVMTDEDYYKFAGLDAFMYTEFFFMSLKIFICAAVYGIVIALPLHYTSVNVVDGVNITGVDYLSMANIEAGSNTLWGDFVAIYVYSTLVYFFTYKTYQKFLRFRIEYLRSPIVHQKCIILRNIPVQYRDPASLTAILRQYYQEKFEYVYIGKNITSLSQTILKRNEAAWTVAHTVGCLVGKKPGIRPSIRVGGYLFCGGRIVDEELHYRQQLDSYNKMYQIQLKDCIEHPLYCDSAVVSFTTVEAAEFARAARNRIDPLCMIPEVCREASDIDWKSLQISNCSRIIRGELVTVATIFLVIFWTIPVAFVSSLSSLTSIVSILPFLGPVVNLSPIVNGFLQGFLPTLALIVFMAILPFIMSALSVFEGSHFSRSQRNIATMHKLYYFQFFNIFLISLIGGTMFSNITQILKTSTIGSMLDLLGVAIPTVAQFFINFVMIKGLTVFPFEILRLGPVIASYIKIRFFCKTKREIEFEQAAPSYSYGVMLPSHLLIFLLSISFSVVNPLILIFSVLFFAIGYVCYRYSGLYMYVCKYETGGEYWPHMFNYMIFALVIAQVVAIVMMITKRAIYEAVFILPLIVFTIRYKRYCNTVLHILVTHTLFII